MFQWQENDVVMDFHQKADLNRVQVGGMPKKSGNIPKKVSLFMTRLGATSRDGRAFPSVVPEFAPALFRFLLLNLKFSV
jgi:hypothetical protein